MSYKELSPKQKQCFSYCAVFPKDSIINVESLIRIWMALGYLGSNSDDMELKGKECFDVLAMRSLFQDFEKNDLDEIISCKMHDIVHDFALFLRKSRKAEALGSDKTSCQVCDPLLVSTVKDFCSLYCNDNNESPSNLCGCLVRLRVINLSDCGLSRNEFSKELPSEIVKLILLQTLRLPNWETPCQIPESLTQLSGLQKLTGFKGESGWSKLGLLKNLNQLDGKDFKDVVEEAQKARLSNKIHIQKLVLEFHEEMEEEEMESSRMDVIDALAPHPNLRILHILFYRGSKLPLWIVSPSNQLKKVALYGCKQLTSLPSLGKLEYLEEIFIYDSMGLQFVGGELLGITTNTTSNFVAFPKLKTLIFWDCGNWKEWEDITAEEEESPAFQVMPSLTELLIRGCPALTVLQHRLLRKASSLEILNLYGSWKLQQRYGNKDGPEWKSISLNNPRLQDNKHWISSSYLGLENPLIRRLQI